MLDIKYILNNENEVKEKLRNRGFNIDIYNEFVELAKKRGQMMFNAQNKKAELTQLSKSFQTYKNDLQKINEIKEQIKIIKEQEASLNKEADLLNQKINEILISIPNLPLNEIPVGENENENKVIFEKPNLGRGLVSNVLPHYEIAQKLDIIDFDRATKLSGSRYIIYKKQGSKLVRALINFMLDLHISKGYTEFHTPVIVKDNILFGTGQLPKFKEDLYKINDSNEYLIPTAEVTLTNYHNNEIVDLNLPFKATSYTECFRSEAGSSGKDTKGILRQHQFKK